MRVFIIDCAPTESYVPNKPGQSQRAAPDRTLWRDSPPTLRSVFLIPDMRILHAISGINPENGGPPIALAGLAAAQVRAGLDVSIVSTWTTDPCPHVVESLQSKGIKVN